MFKKEFKAKMRSKKEKQETNVNHFYDNAIYCVLTSVNALTSHIHKIIIIMNIITH